MKVGNENYILIYHDILYLNITSIIDIKLIIELCMRCKFNSSIVSLTTFDRLQIMQKLNISKSSFSNSLLRLKNIGILNGISGRFEINPEYLRKGTNNMRNRFLKNK